MEDEVGEGSLGVNEVVGVENDAADHWPSDLQSAVGQSPSDPVVLARRTCCPVGEGGVRFVKHIDMQIGCSDAEALIVGTGSVV